MACFLPVPWQQKPAWFWKEDMSLGNSFRRTAGGSKRSGNWMSKRGERYACHNRTQRASMALLGESFLSCSQPCLPIFTPWCPACLGHDVQMWCKPLCFLPYQMIKFTFNVGYKFFVNMIWLFFSWLFHFLCVSSKRGLNQISSASKLNRWINQSDG